MSLTLWKNFAKSLCSIICEIGRPCGQVNGFSQVLQFLIISCIWKWLRYVFAFTAALHDVVISICSSILSIFPEICSKISDRISFGEILERICGTFLNITSFSDMVSISYPKCSSLYLFLSSKSISDGETWIISEIKR